MNFSLARASLIGEVDMVGIAGERAVCDPRGVLYFPDLRLLAVSDLHLESESFDPEPAPDADVLILAGDIDRRWQGFERWPLLAPQLAEWASSTLG